MKKLPNADDVIEEGIFPCVCNNAYELLHELSHIICGYSCCREHCEFEAHGGAKVLAKVIGIYDRIDWKAVEQSMACYAGRSSHEACGRIRTKKVRKRKKRKGT